MNCFLRIKNGDIIRAESYGNSKYRMIINLKTKEMECSCPCDFECKHLAGLVIWLKNNKPFEISQTDNLLKSKSKNELIAILSKIIEEQPEMKKHLQSLDDKAIKDLIRKLWITKDHVAFFNKLDFIKGEILKKKRFDLAIDFLRKLIDIYDHTYDFYEFEDYIREFLETVLDEKITKNQKEKILKMVKDYPFDLD